MYVSMKEMLENADSGKYAVMAINCFNLETIRSVIRAAESERAPIIINIFHEHMTKHIDSSIVAPMVRTLAENATVEVALNYDHGVDEELVIKAINDGYSSVMIDASRFEYSENIRITKSLTEYAHERGVSVEAELGSIGGAEGSYTTVEDMTDPSQAKYFVQQTGIDCLAVSYGSSHGDYPDGEYPELDFERLKEIKKETNLPLVLHGGSGVGEENVKKSVEYGICKINVGNDFMKANTAALKEASKRNLTYLDMIKYAEEKSQEVVKKYIRWSNSSNKTRVEVN